MYYHPYFCLVDFLFFFLVDFQIVVLIFQFLVNSMCKKVLKMKIYFKNCGPVNLSFVYS